MKKIIFTIFLVASSSVGFASDDVTVSQEETSNLGKDVLATNFRFIEKKIISDLKRAEASREKYKIQLDVCTDIEQTKYLSGKIESIEKKIDTLKSAELTLTLWKTRMQ